MAGTSSKTPASFADGLNGIIQACATAMAAPDADVKFCQSIMTATVGKMRTPSQHSPTAGAGGAGMPPGGAMSGGAPGGIPAGQPMPGGPAGGGQANQQMPNLSGPASSPAAPGSALPQGLTPNPDELRRMIQQNSAGG